MSLILWVNGSVILDHDINGEILLCLNDFYLKEIGVHNEIDRLKILLEVKKLTYTTYLRHLSLNKVLLKVIVDQG